MTPEPIIYIASKVKFAPIWRHLRALGVPINSTWIDEAEKGQTKSYTNLWHRCEQEIRECTNLILFHPYKQDILKGALVEIGIAIGANREVICVARPDDFTFFQHLGVAVVHDLRLAFTATGVRLPAEFVNYTINDQGLYGRYGP